MYRVLLLLVLSFSSQAHESEVIWVKYAQSSQGIATLEFTDYGLPRLYLSMKQSFVCNPKLVLPSTQRTLKVDGVNIPFRELCIAAGVNQYGVSMLTPKGDIATNYVMKHFNENKFVIVDGVYFSAKGFSKAYSIALSLIESNNRKD